MSKYGVFSGPYFPVLGLNTEIYGVNFHIQSEYGKNTEYFLAVALKSAFNTAHRVHSFSMYADFFKNWLFFPSDMHTYAWLSGGKKC